MKEGALLDSALTWYSSRDGLLGSGGSIVISSLTTGSHVLTLVASAARGKTASASVTFDVRPEADIPLPTLWVSSPDNVGTYFESLPIWFSAGAASVKDGVLGRPDVGWASDRQGSLSDELSFECASLATGAHTIRFWARASLGRVTTTTRAISVKPLS